VANERWGQTFRQRLSGLRELTVLGWRGTGQYELMRWNLTGVKSGQGSQQRRRAGMLPTVRVPPDV